MLEKIIYHFPTFDTEIFDSLKVLLAEIPSAIVKDESIELKACHPTNSKPVTVFKLSSVKFPKITFQGIDELNLKIGNVSLSGNAEDGVELIEDYKGKVKITELKDYLGQYLELNINGNNYYQLPLSELIKRLKGHIVRIDHTGLNIPASIINKDEWDNIVQKIAKFSNLYKYPTGEDWPFILPATKDEFKSDIKDFPMGREPKFELVYDSHSPVPTIQIDIETDLERSEVEKILPEPYGISFPDLADYFRTVFIYHPWRGLSIRFDVRFKNNEVDGAWETGRWLVEKGGRIQ